MLSGADENDANLQAAIVQHCIVGKKIIIFVQNATRV
jgi:hypothetical protein